MAPATPPAMNMDSSVGTRLSSASGRRKSSRVVLRLGSTASRAAASENTSPGSRRRVLPLFSDSAAPVTATRPESGASASDMGRARRRLRISTAMPRCGAAAALAARVLTALGWAPCCVR